MDGQLLCRKGVHLLMFPESSQAIDTANKEASQRGREGRRKRGPSPLGLRAITHPRAEGPPPSSPRF